jgi:hypothetical protein
MPRAPQKKAPRGFLAGKQKEEEEVKMSKKERKRKKDSRPPPVFQPKTMPAEVIPKTVAISPSLKLLVTFENEGFGSTTGKVGLLGLRRGILSYKNTIKIQLKYN